jgi:hypothetical protein
MLGSIRGAIRIHFAIDLYENLGQRRSPLRVWTRSGADSRSGWSAGACEINCQKLKILLAMTIDSDTYSDTGVSQGTVSRGYVGKNLSICLCFERLLRSALWGDGLPFQRVGGECAGFA